MKRGREEDSLGRDGKRPGPTHIPFSSADGEAVHHVPSAASNGTKGSRIRYRRALKIHGESPRHGIPTRLRAAGGTPQESRPLSLSAPFPSGYLGRPGRRTSGLRLPPIGASDERQGPAPAPAQPASGVRAVARPEAPRRPAASPRPAPGQEAPLPRPLHPPPRSPGALSPQDARTIRRKAWAPWCRRHRRLPLFPAFPRLAKQRRAAAEAAAQARAPAAAAATSTSGRGSAHP